MMIPPQAQRPPEPAQNFPSRQGPPSGVGEPQPRPIQGGQTLAQSSPTIQQHERSFSQGPPQSQVQASQYNSSPLGRNATSHVYSANQTGPPQLSTLPFQSSAPVSTSFQQQVPKTSTPPPIIAKSGDLLPLKPVFGMTLEELFIRDNSAVPMIVYQCIQAVDLYGLEVEGIYRLSGTSSHVTKLKAMFDNGTPTLNPQRYPLIRPCADASKVDFRNPENFFHDVNSVAGLLKQFFRDLPDPLLTKENYAAFIDAASMINHS